MSGKIARSRTYSRLGWTRLAVVAILILITILLASFAALSGPSRAYAAGSTVGPGIAAGYRSEAAAGQLPGQDPVSFS
jgi:hypothetical protein